MLNCHKLLQGSIDWFSIWLLKAVHIKEDLTCCPISRKYPANRCACSSLSPAVMCKNSEVVHQMSDRLLAKLESSTYGISDTNLAIFKKQKR
jgi:hypothetical protein